jgi:hypothetical protein
MKMRDRERLEREREMREREKCSLLLNGGGICVVVSGRKARRGEEMKGREGR